MSVWCQRSRNPDHTWRHTSEGGFDPRRYEVSELSWREARDFVVANHYSASFPPARFRYGLYDGPWLVGAASLSVPMRREVLTDVFPDLAPYDETLELGRFVLADAVPACAETWFLARIWERAAAEGIRGVVSFTDPVPRTAADGRLVFPGHVGVIYQAGNADSLGHSKPRTLLLLPDGHVLNDRTLQKIRAGEPGGPGGERQLVGHGARPRRAGEDPRLWLRGALEQARVRRLGHLGCHRYAFRIGPRRERVRLGLPVTAYPCTTPGCPHRKPCPGPGPS
jgi:hypothetical protein